MTANKDQTTNPMNSAAEKQHFAAFMADFSMDQVEAQFTGSLKEGFNACVECCDKQVAAGRGDEVGLFCEAADGTSSKHTWAELQAKSAQFANFLASQGVKAGDRISCMLPRTADLLVVVLGTWRIGAVYQPLFTAFGYEAIEYRINQCDSKVVVTDAANRHKFDQVKGLPTVVQVCENASEAGAKGDLHFASVVAAQSDQFEPVILDAEQPFLQMFTSGTVGKSKGVAVPLKALLGFYIYMKYAIGLEQDDKYWNVADPGWAYGLYYAITGPLCMGVATHFNEAGFTTENTYEMLEKYQITNLAAAPTAYRMMMASDAHKEMEPKLVLRRASSAGEPLSPEVVNWVSDVLGCPVMDHYGQTETGMTCCNHHALEHNVHIGAMGYALPGYRVVALDADYNEVSPGEEGQFAVDMENSPAFFFQGYTWQEKKPFHGKYYLTGDMVFEHRDGCFQFSGRDDDIITTAGYRVGPADVEGTVLEHEAVAESAAVGKPDAKRGHIIKSFVVLRDGHEASDELVQDIQNMVRERLSTHAFPREIEFVDELPKTPSGKIQRFILRKQAEDEAASA